MNKINVLIDCKYEVAGYMLAFNTDVVELENLKLWCDVVKDYYMSNEMFASRVNLFIPCTDKSYGELVIENLELNLFDFDYKNGKLNTIKLNKNKSFEDLQDLHCSSLINELQYTDDIIPKYLNLLYGEELEK